MSGSNAWTCSVDELAQVCGGRIVSSSPSAFSRVGTDSRANLTGRLFIPLKGDTHDAHDYVAQAVQNGAVCILVQQWRPEWQALSEKVAFVQVTDTLQALQSLAREWRRKNAFTVIAITGSNGKTSTKEFVFALLKDHVAVHASYGSFNNHWGVPLSILEAGPEHTHLILEMGMNHAGEIWRLCQIAEPDVVTVTTVGRAHIGELGSQDAVAQAKEEIYTACPKAVHVFNGDNEWTMRMQARSHSKQIVFSAFKPTADVHLRAQRMTWEGLDLVGQIRGARGQTWVHVMGRQNTVNLMAAAGLALAVGLPAEKIWSGLGHIHDSAWGRNQLVQLESGARLLWDGYNANPDSMTALLKNLYEMEIAGRKYLIVGDMLELGTFTDKAHEEIGERAGAVAFEGVWYVGKNAEAFQRGYKKAAELPKFWRQSLDVDQALAKDFLAQLNADDLVAAKASRGLALERVFMHWPLKTPLGKKP